MTALGDRLAGRSIARVYCIDDDNVPPLIQTADEAAAAIATQQTRRMRAFAALDSRFNDVSLLRQQISNLEVDERSAQLRPVVDELATQQGLQGKDFEALRATLYQGYKGETAEKLRVPFPGRLLTSLSFAEWQRDAEQILGSATATSRILLLVDEINTREPDVDLDGVKLLASLWRSHRGALAFIDVIVLTSHCRPAQEFAEAQTLLESVRAELRDPALEPQVTRAFVLSKDRLDQQPLEQQFVIHLNRLQAAQLRGELVTLTTQVLQEAIRDSVSWLEQIPLSQFQGSVFVSSESEGAAEIDTLLRMAAIRQRVGLEKKLRMDGELRAKIAAMRSFSLKAIDADQVTASQLELRQLRQQEFERAGDHVNSLLAPLACGDVFIFKSDQLERTAMLLANPCDLVMRSDGTRKLRRGWLVELTKGAKAELLQREQQQGARAPLSYMLPTGNRDEDEAYLFNNSSIEAIDLAVLDLCWTNEGGKVAFDPRSAQQAAQFVLPPQGKRLLVLARRVNEAKFTTIELWGYDFAPVVEQAENVELGNVRTSTRVSYEIRRDWRLAPEFAGAVLSAMSQCIARPVFGHDYRRIE
jgi:hypothetical protein